MPELAGRDSADYRARTAALRRRVEREGLPCWLCGQPIDLSLHYTHSMSFTADHLHPLARGGRLLGKLMPAHRSCNARRGKGKAMPRRFEPLRTSRRW